VASVYFPFLFLVNTYLSQLQLLLRSSRELGMLELGAYSQFCKTRLRENMALLLLMLWLELGWLLLQELLASLMLARKRPRSMLWMMARRVQLRTLLMARRSKGSIANSH
jgi:hypothetical protein